MSRTSYECLMYVQFTSCVYWVRESFFHLDTLKTTFLMEDLSQEWTQLGYFFPKSGQLFPFSNKVRNGLLPPPSLVAHQRGYNGISDGDRKIYLHVYRFLEILNFYFVPSSIRKNIKIDLLT